MPAGAVNGLIAKVQSFTKDPPSVTLQPVVDPSRVFVITPRPRHVYRSVSDKEPIATRTQLPLQLYHATTIHGLQGSTVRTPLYVDMSKLGSWPDMAEQRAILVVAFSRTTSLDKLFVKFPHKFNKPKLLAILKAGMDDLTCLYTILDACSKNR